MLSREVPPNHSVDRKVRGHFAGMKFMAHPLEYLCADRLPSALTCEAQRLLSSRCKCAKQEHISQIMCLYSRIARMVC